MLPFGLTFILSRKLDYFRYLSEALVLERSDPARDVVIIAATHESLSKR